MNLNTLALTGLTLINATQISYQDFNSMDKQLLYSLPQSVLTDTLRDIIQEDNLSISPNMTVFTFEIYGTSDSIIIQSSREAYEGDLRFLIDSDIIIDYLSQIEDGAYSYVALDPFSLVGDGQTTSLEGVFEFCLQDSNDESLAQISYQYDILYYSDEILLDDGSYLNGTYSDMIDISGLPGFDLDFILNNWYQNIYNPASLTENLFNTIGETVSAYVLSITSMFNELMLLFYADNKLTYLSQLLLVGIGIGITKWGMNFVKDRVRL